MPIYEYKCDNGHIFDVIQRISEDSLTSCMKCDAPVKKILHPVNIAFKGSGFYSTDYNGSRTSDKSGVDKSDSSSSNGDSEHYSSSASDSSKSDSTGKKSEGSSARKSA